MKNTLLLLFVVIALTTTTTALHAKACPSDDVYFCSNYKAAEQGEAKAQYSLGVMYAKGEGVKKDEHEAYIWFSIAKANGNELATKVLEQNWHDYLTTAEIKSARREAAQRLETIKPLITK